MKPDPRYVKLNGDASFYEDTCAGSVGAVLRDYEGSFIAAESDSMETIEACTGEARWWNESSSIFADCVDIASVIGIGIVDFKHCPREANKVAYEIVMFCFLNNCAYN